MYWKIIQITKGKLALNHSILHFSYVKTHSCIRICSAALYEAAKIHVQIMRFRCCLNMGLNLIKPKLLCLHDAKWESVAALTDYFIDAFVRVNVALIYDVVAT